MTWRISSWSRELGRGTIDSDHYRGIAFDAACADVDDFRIGELVHINLVESTDPPRVRRIWPDDPRYPQFPGAPLAPALRADLQEAAQAALRAFRPCLDYSVASIDHHSVVIEGDDSHFEYGHVDELIIHDPCYVDLPFQFEIKYVRVATDAERSHLHSSKTELDPAAVAITLIGGAGEFYFVVGSGVRYALAR